MSATTGRPPTPIEDKRVTFQTFIDAVEDGATVKQACKDANVSWAGIAKWIADESNTTEDGVTFAARYAHARFNSGRSFADKALDAAMTATVEDVQVARLRVDTYKWRAAMADPKGYGERRQVDTSVTVRMLPPEERDKALQRIIARATVTPTLANPLPDTTLAPDIDTPSDDTDDDV